MKIRVYYEDTDCGNVVYYANYLKYMERSRTEFLRERGVDLAAYHEKGLLFTVAEANVRYKAPAQYNDLLDAESVVKETGNSSVVLATTIKRARDGLLLTEGEVRLVCVNAAGRPTRIPEEIKSALK
ncbi:MAG: YbgC/FadM family acyl-CoA thioesterase [Chitinispirillaceae bacterium]|nr:YbgC/FadM family acyl-CoA thioesterase [Chitinispirillaceae bacterium]